MYDRLTLVSAFAHGKFVNVINKHVFRMREDINKVKMM